MLFIAALKIRAVHGLILSILKSGRYSGNVFRGFPGEVEQSLSPPCVCVRNHGGRAAPLLPLPLPNIARLCVFRHRQIRQLIEERRTVLSCLCVVRLRPCSQLSCNSTHCSTSLQNLQECGINSRYRLHSRVALVGNRGGRRDCIVAQERCR